jgi:hypothetical protein
LPWADELKPFGLGREQEAAETAEKKDVAVEALRAENWVVGPREEIIASGPSC